MKNKILTLVAAILAVLTVPTIGAYAAPSANLDQCRNGPADNPVNCTGGAWVNGNVGAQQGHLSEGYSIPYRARLEQLPPDTKVSLVLGYDIKHSDKFAIDYLTYYQRLDSPPGSHLLTYGHNPETVDPTSGVAFTGPTTTFPIPAPSSAGTPVDDQPNASFNNLTAAEKIMTLFGGTITDIKYVTQGSLTNSQSETRIMVNFTTNSTCPLVKGVQQCTAVLSWGGHIGSRQDWGFTNGVPNSAGGISGSPYHMRLISWNLSNLGNQDRSLSAGAVVAPSTITIIKNTIPDDPQIFSYITTGTGLSSFNLADNGTGPNSTTFGGLASGTYTVTEGAVAGFNLTALSCADPSSDTTINLGTHTASISLSAGETVTCTFENTKNATLTVVKDAIPNDDQLFNFTGSAGIGSFTLKDNGTSTNSTTFSLEPGTYSVSETVPAGWVLATPTCSDGSTVDSIGLGAGESVTCTFTNTKNATIIVNKTAIGGDDTFNFTTTGDNGFPQSFSLTTSNGNSSQTFNNILPDQTYSVSEPVPPAGWVLTNSSCTKGTPASFSPAPGETVTCTFENTKNATLTIVKDAIPDDERVFNFTGSAGIGSFKLKDNGTLPNSTTFVLLPGIYNVSETVPAGWNLTSATCSDGSAVDSIGLSPGESVTCTFTNAKLHLSFIKEGALDFAGQTTDYMINVTNDGFANLTIVNMTDTTGILICDTKFPRLLAVGDTISCSVLFATDSDINATTIIEILAQPANMFWRV